MIKKITIRDVASYDHEGCTFDDLAKVNIILGGNGTGKTTIGRVVKENSLLKGHFEHCEVEWVDDTEKIENIYLFNKEFKEDNQREHILGVYKLGEQWETVEKQRESLKDKRQELQDLALKACERVFKAEQRLEEEQTILEEYLWENLHEPLKDFTRLLAAFNRKASFAERVRKELWIIKQEKSSRPSRMGKTITEAEKEKRQLVTDVEEMRQRYHELYEGANAKVDKSDLMSGRVFFDREMLRFDFWRYIAAKAKSEVKRAERVLKVWEKKLKKYKKEEEEARTALSRIDFAVEGEHDMISSKQPAIDSINKTLDDCGFTGFRIDHSPLFKDDFQIQREDGSLVKNTLSEGELTFISFLYFMEYATGDLSGFPLIRSKVMVIDDPISSLDDSAIHVVSMKLAELVTKIVGNTWKKNEFRVSQLIIMTHNYRFYKMLMSELRRKDVKCWMLTKSNGVTKAKEIKGDENPVKDEYVTLWEMVRDVNEKMEMGMCDVRDVIILPNTIRKILERYFVTFGGYDRLKMLPKGFSNKPEEVVMAKSLLKWADEGCHEVGDDRFMEPPTVLAGRYLKVFRKLFEKLGQEEHYRMMMREE